MTACALCRAEIQPGTKAISIVGGLFPQEDPDFFMIDPTILSEAHAHFDCFAKVIKKGVPRDPGSNQSDGGGTRRDGP